MNTFAPKEIRLFRAALGAYFIYYYLSLLPHVFDWYGSSGMFNPKTYPPLQPSFLFLFFDSKQLISVLFTATLLFFCLFAIGRCPRILFIFLYLFHLSFHHANPLIIHEPQQLANLFLLFFLFMPLNQFSGKYTSSYLRVVVRILILFLGVYYLLAGLKKLPDPLWLRGEALIHLLNWPALSKDGFLSFWVSKIHILGWFLNYGALWFELTFILFIFHRFRIFYTAVAYGFQAFILLTLDVGSFPYLMMAWQVLLLDESSMAFFRRVSFGKKSVI